MKKILLGLGLCIMIVAGYSQQLFQTTQFMVNPYTLNPALAGSEDFIDIKAGYRNQWLGLVESDNHTGEAIAPRTMYLSAHTALGHAHGYYRDPRNEHKNFHGVGGFITSDKLGAYTSTSAYGSYSFNMQLIKSKKKGQMFGFNGRDKHIGVRMVVGTHLGVIQQQVDFGKLVDNTNGNPNTDPIVATKGVESKIAPDASLGTWIYSNYFYAGLAIRRVLGNNISFPSDADFTLERHLNLMGGYKLFLSNNFMLEPSLQYKAEGKVSLSSLDLNMLVAYDNTYSNSRGIGASKSADMHIYAGTTFRPGSALSFLLGGVFMRKYEVAYSFDLTTNQINPYEKGTHEVTVGYRIEPSKVFRTAENQHHR